MTNGSVEDVIGRSREDVDQPGLLARAFEPLTRSLFAEAGLRGHYRLMAAFDP